MILRTLFLLLQLGMQVTYANVAVDELNALILKKQATKATAQKAHPEIKDYPVIIILLLFIEAPALIVRSFRLY